MKKIVEEWKKYSKKTLDKRNEAWKDCKDDEMPDGSTIPTIEGFLDYLVLKDSNHETQ